MRLSGYVPVDLPKSQVLHLKVFTLPEVKTFPAVTLSLSNALKYKSQKFLHEFNESQKKSNNKH